MKEASSSDAAQGTSLAARIAVWSARHRRRIVLGWLAVVIAAAAANSLVPANTDMQGEAPGESGAALKLFQERFGETQVPTQEIVVFSSPKYKVTDAVYKDKVQALMAQLTDLREAETKTIDGTKVVSSTRVVSATLTHYDIGMPRDASPFVAPGEAGDVTFALVSLQGSAWTAKDHVQPVLDEVARADEPSAGFSIMSGGPASINKQMDTIISEDLSFALIMNLTVTLVILLLVFRAPVAASIPLALAMAAVITATAILGLISQAMSLSILFTEVVLLMGLATGIDYSLFVVSRFRNERRKGRSKEDALRAAAGTSGKAVVFAGCTVVLAVSGMFLVGDSTFNSIGLASIVVVVLAVLISVTLLPALLMMLADHIDRFSLPFLKSGGEGGGIWGFITDHVLRRPVVLAVGVLAVLLATAYPALTLNLGFNGAKGLPDAVAAKKALLVLQDNFTLGLSSPALVVVDAGKDRNVYASDVQSRVSGLVSSVQAESTESVGPDAPYGAPIQTSINDAGDTEAIRIPLNADTGEQKALDAVDRLRKDIVPASFGGGTAKALVTGDTAANIDFRDNIIFRTPFVFMFVLGLAFLILLVTFRSIVIAVKAIILNLLSVGATYGLLVLVFQKGWLLEGVLDFKATGIIESWLPLFLFTILFGLSMDYHMFVLSRIKEAHEHGANSDDAVSMGIRATAGTITSAALIMVAVAMIFAFTRFIGLKQFGFGLAVAILIDATVIRSILLPASMKLLGDYNWYLPKWLEWLPKVRMAE
ncbi:MAG: MMPL family transporter [Dehalococcoidia bacterium]|nr:MMPL family transporter [Dehalococcoidia bacterium]